MPGCVGDVEGPASCQLLTIDLARWATVPSVKLAAFDVDGTLTTKDCVMPFLRAVNGTARSLLGMTRHARELVPGLVRRDRDRLKALASAVVFTGRPISDVELLGDRFAGRVVSSWLRRDTMAVLRDHQRLGHEVVLVSASFGVYLRPLGTALGIDRTNVIATELAVDHDGRCTGRLDGGNCRGEAKVDRLHDWLRLHRTGRDGVEIWAYGDSPGDAAMLADADHAVWVT
jgi:phosphatidylglycerophosphatase C